jgi:signal transduction histidine kinase
MHHPGYVHAQSSIVTPKDQIAESRLSQFVNRFLLLSPWLLAVVFSLFVFVCNAALDWYMLHHHQSTVRTVQISDVISAVIAGLLFWKVAQYRRERRRALRQRLEMIGEMNHHIRNALEVIALSAHTSTDQQHMTDIRNSVDRINWALKEILPRM